MNRTSLTNLLNCLKKSIFWDSDKYPWLEEGLKNANLQVLFPKHFSQVVPINMP